MLDLLLFIILLGGTMINFEKDGIEYRFFDHLYAVSQCGKVLRKLSTYTPAKHNLGYLCLGRMRLMHRVVAACWVPNPENKPNVHHINGIKSDNRASNLEWVTQKEHMRDHHHVCGHHIRSPETRMKLRLNRLGKKDSPETIKKKIVGFDLYRNKTKCRFNGTEYPTLVAGAVASGLEYSTFRARCLSKNFPAYELL